MFIVNLGDAYAILPCLGGLACPERALRPEPRASILLLDPRDVSAYGTVPNSLRRTAHSLREGNDLSLSYSSPGYVSSIHFFLGVLFLLFHQAINILVTYLVPSIMEGTLKRCGT